MRAVDVVRDWVEAFNAGDADRLAAFYTDNATNHQVVGEPVTGRAAIRDMFIAEFAAAEMTCLVEAIHDAGPVATLEWRDPNGLRGCGVFHVEAGRITFQRGYFDKLSFLRLHNLPVA